MQENAGFKGRNGKAIFCVTRTKYDEALVAYETSIQLDPKFASPWYSKGLALRSLNRDLEAEEVFAKANVAGIGKLEAFN